MGGDWTTNNYAKLRDFSKVQQKVFGSSFKTSNKFGWYWPYVDYTCTQDGTEFGKGAYYKFMLSYIKSEFLKSVGAGKKPITENINSSNAGTIYNTPYHKIVWSLGYYFPDPNEVKGTDKKYDPHPNGRLGSFDITHWPIYSDYEKTDPCYYKYPIYTNFLEQFYKNMSPDYKCVTSATYSIETNGNLPTCKPGVRDCCRYHWQHWKHQRSPGHFMDIMEQSRTEYRKTSIIDKLKTDNILQNWLDAWTDAQCDVRAAAIDFCYATDRREHSDTDEWIGTAFTNLAKAIGVRWAIETDYIDKQCLDGKLTTSEIPTISSYDITQRSLERIDEEGRVVKQSEAIGNGDQFKNDGGKSGGGSATTIGNDATGNPAPLPPNNPNNPNGGIPTWIWLAGGAVVIVVGGFMLLT